MWGSYKERETRGFDETVRIDQKVRRGDDFSKIMKSVLRSFESC